MNLVVRRRKDKAAELAARADGLETQIGNPGSTDDPRWLRRRMANLRRRAEKRRKGREYKLRQR